MHWSIANPIPLFQVGSNNNNNNNGLLQYIYRVALHLQLSDKNNNKGSGQLIFIGWPMLKKDSYLHVRPV